MTIHYPNGKIEITEYSPENKQAKVSNTTGERKEIWVVSDKRTAFGYIAVSPGGTGYGSWIPAKAPDGAKIAIVKDPRVDLPRGYHTDLPKIRYMRVDWWGPNGEKEGGGKEPPEVVKKIIEAFKEDPAKAIQIVLKRFGKLVIGAIITAWVVSKTVGD